MTLRSVKKPVSHSHIAVWSEAFSPKRCVNGKYTPLPLTMEKLIPTICDKRSFFFFTIFLIRRGLKVERNDHCAGEVVLKFLYGVDWLVIHK